MLLKIVIAVQENVEYEEVFIAPVESFYSYPNNSPEYSEWYFDPKYFPDTRLRHENSHNLDRVILEKQGSNTYHLNFLSKNKDTELPVFIVASVTVVANYPEP